MSERNDLKLHNQSREHAGQGNLASMTMENVRRTVRNRTLRNVTVFIACLVVFFTTYSLILPAITQEAPTYCGSEEHVHDETCYTHTVSCNLEEHTHTDECYGIVRTLTCGQEEHAHDETCYDEAGNLLCTLPEHAHTDACYEEQESLLCQKPEHTHTEACETAELTCGKESHLHSLQCFSNPEADTDDSGWLRLLPKELGGTPAENLLRVAESQVGYQESPNNYLVESDGVTAHGYTIYGARYGAPYGTWDGAFASWCMEQAGITETGTADTARMAEALQNMGLFRDSVLEAEPGSLVFYQAGQDLRVGILKEISLDEDGNLTRVALLQGGLEGTVGSKILQDRELGTLTGCGVLPEAVETTLAFTAPPVPETIENSETPVAEAIGAAPREDLNNNASALSQTQEEKDSGYSIDWSRLSWADMESTNILFYHSDQSFSGQVEDLYVTVNAPAGTFPEGTVLYLYPVDARYVTAAVESAMAGTVGQIRAVDISFWCDGKEIEPENPVQVTISTDLQKASVVHVADDGEATVVDSETDTEEGIVSFEAGSFSIYAVVDNTIETTIDAGDGYAYHVSVTYGPEAQIPEGSTLRVTRFDEGTEEYSYARNAVLADKMEKGERVDTDYFGLAALDISILDPSGREIEPAASVQVDLSIQNLPNVENLEDVAGTIQIQHHVETEDGVVIEQVYDSGTAEASFDVSASEDVIAEGTAVDPDSVKDWAENKNTDDEHRINTTFEVEVFSTYTISWYYYVYRSYNVHYVDTNGNSLTPSIAPTFSNGYNYLIYDIEGYEYDSTHLSSRTGTSITPLLRTDSYYDKQYWRNGSWHDLRDDIYVVYKPKTAPTTGGTPQVSVDETWPAGSDTPQFGKSSTNNGNGTNTISLSITAAEKPIEKKTPADVIVVFDVSGSMSESMNGQTRLSRAQTAVNNMANTLLNAPGSDVRMALISFSTTATTVQGFTNNYNTFRGKVNGLSASGGTNWEQALQMANNMEVRSNASTFVVFVTDGDPTFRVSRGNVSDANLDLYTSDTYQYYRSNQVFGEGNNDSEERNFDFAVDQVEAIAAKNKNFYAIGISDSVTKVQNLVTEGGVSADHAVTAANSTALTNAFKSITESIKSSLGFGDVQITDGITDLTNVDMKVMQSVDPNSFKYYRYGGEGNKYGTDAAHKTEWTTRATDGCGPASYNEATGAVEWNMGSGFQLEDGVTYVVEFRAWPSQEAYDLVSDLNNGIKVYAPGSANSITAEEHEQVVELAAPTSTTQGSYALKTNTDEVSATYKKTTKTGDVVTISDSTPVTATYTPGTMEQMQLESMQLTIKKTFEDDLTAGEDRDTQVTLVLKRRDAHQTPEATFADYPVPQGGTTSANIVLNDANNWTYTLYVAPGFEIDGHVLEHGYDFTVAEPGIDYHYDLVEEIINPMVVDGVDVYYGDGHSLDSETVIEEYVDRSITAINRVKSGINVRKILLDEDGNELHSDVEFTIKGKLLGPDGNPYTWTNGDSVDKSGAYHKYDADGNRIVYKGHFADSSNIEFTLKPGEYVRFINVPEGCTFEFEEDTATFDEGYEWVSSTGTTQHRTGPGGAFTTDGDEQPTVENGKVSVSTGVVGNKEYNIVFTNQVVPVEKTIEIRKTDMDGSELENATFDLLVRGDTWTKVSDVGVNGRFTIGSISIENKLLPDAIYKLEEKTAPAGYVILSEGVYFKIHEGKLVLTDETGAPLTDEEDQNIEESEYVSITNPPEGDVLTITVRNAPGAELPHTGGLGTAPYVCIGLTLLLLSGFCMLSTRRRRAA